MSMVINTNVQAIRTHGVYNTNNTAMNEAMTRVATGMKVSSAKDNASVWAITQRMRDRIRANDQANQNVQNDSALIRTAQGGIDNTVSILTTLKERAINAANDSNLNLDRGAIATEVEQLALQIDDNATKVKFNGRFLLNGAEDTTVANFNGSSSSANSSSAIVEPTAATMPASSANTRGTHAMYKLLDSSWRVNSSGTAASTAAAEDVKLTDLVSSSVTTGTTVTDADRAFKVGDTITFSWKENGEEKSYSYNVTSASKVSDLAFQQDHLKVAHYASSTAAQTFTSKDTIAADQTVKDNAGTTKQIAANNTTDMGLYAIGDKGVAITDFKVAVTYNDELNDNTLTTRVDGQNALKFTGVQQVSGTDTASNAVFKMTSGASAAITKDSYVTSFLSGYFSNSSLTSTDKVTFSFGDDKSVTVQGDNTMEELQAAFAEKGINVTLVQNADTNGVQLKDVKGNFVVPDDADKQVYTTAAAASNKTDVYFIGEKGEALSGLKITAVSNDLQTDRVTTGTYASSDNKSLEATAIYKIKEDSETTAAASSSSASTPLTFHIGGEQDFAIDVTIEKMTVDNLFAEKDANGNVTKTYDAKSFATLFTDKDGAKVAMGLIDNALNTALAEQTKLGAIENRLGYTSDNLTTMNENLEAANSAYRDSDIAKEMTQYMKYAVLSQASQYMLSQASQNAYSILNLLQA